MMGIKIIWLSNKTFARLSLLSEEKSLTKFLKLFVSIPRKSLKKWQHWKKGEVGSTSILQEQNGFNVFSKLSLCLCCRKWLKPKRNQASNLVLVVLLILFALGLRNFRTNFRNKLYLLELWTSRSSLFLSVLAKGKKHF